MAFLESLTDQGFLTNPAFAAPAAGSSTPAKTVSDVLTNMGLPGHGLMATARG